MTESCPSAQRQQAIECWSAASPTLYCMPYQRALSQQKGISKFASQECMLACCWNKSTPDQSQTSTSQHGQKNQTAKHSSNPPRIRSLSRSRPMKTILLYRFSSAFQGLSGMHSNSMCTPCSNTICYSAQKVYTNTGSEQVYFFYGQQSIRICDTCAAQKSMPCTYWACLCLNYGLCNVPGVTTACHVQHTMCISCNNKLWHNLCCLQHVTPLQSAY